MEQTLGNRIVHHRKKLGLTQDQLAEKLGVTAQAVSKWENDQSCPDITMLPKLAALFGISIDTLLGHEAAKEQVHEAEIVDDADCEENENEGVHIQNGNWEFKWDSGRRNAVGFACWVLLMGALLLAQTITQTDIGFWSIAWPSALVMLGLFGGEKFSFFRLGCVLLGGWFLLDHFSLTPFELGGEIIWPALVIFFGIGLLVDALRKPKKPHFSVKHNGKIIHGNLDNKEKVSRCDMDGNTFDCENCFGDESYLICADHLEHGNIENNFSSSTVDLSGVKAVAKDCSINIQSNFGKLTILVPRRYAVHLSPETAFGSVQTAGEPSPSPEGIISMHCEANFGSVLIQYN